MTSATRHDRTKVDLSFLVAAGTWYMHAEIVVQQRLYNYFVAATILLAAIATVLAASSAGTGEAANLLAAQRKAFVIALAILGTLLSVAYTLLGARQRKFVRLHKDVAMHLARSIGSHPRQYLREFTQLQSEFSTTLPFSNQLVSLSKWQRFGSSEY